MLGQETMKETVLDHLGPTGILSEGDNSECLGPLLELKLMGYSYIHSAI